MAVYFKFKSAKDYDSIPIEGQFISVGNLKERIFESKHLGRGTDFDLMVSNAQSNEEYVDEGTMIPKNTSVLIRRVPGRPRKPIITAPEEPKVEEDKVENLPPQSSAAFGDSSTMKIPEEPDWDEFGNDLYSIPEVIPAQSVNPVVDYSPANKVDEDSKIKALVDTPALDWNRPQQDAFGSGRGFGRGMGGRMMAGHGFGRGGLERKTPPAGYICHRCKVPGHFIQHCPTNGDPKYDIKRVKPPTGIPKSMLMATSDGSYALPNGSVAVLKPNEAAFEKEIEGMPTTRPSSDLPPELRCPLCKEVMKDAVLTSKCCFSSFCYKCIRDYIISKSECVCGASNILADDLLPNKTLRETISRILESGASSTDNAGSFVQVQDMESARPLQPRAASPTTFSAALKEEPKQPPATEHSSGLREGEGASEAKDINLDQKTAKSMDPPVATPESMSAKEPTSQESAPVPEEVQEKFVAGDQGKKKKKKKIRLPGIAADMQWKAYQDVGPENYGMPLMPPSYNPYLASGMPMGFDAFMPPFNGAMHYMGYAPGPFDVPFGGMLPQDPFGGQGYMFPVGPQRDLAELGVGGMAMNQGPPIMSREEFEARKADLRRKREMERRSGREHSKDRGNVREASSSADVSSMKPKPRVGPPPQPAPMGRIDRPDKPKSLDWHGPVAWEREPARELPRDSSGRHSPKRAADRHRSAERDADQKRKASVFSRISFPAGGSSSGDKKRKSSELTPSGLKDHDEAGHRPTSNGHHHRDDWKAAGSGSKSSASAPARRGGGGNSSAYDHESSEEEHHFKRRPSSRHREADLDEVEVRPSRRSSRDRDHDRPASKRR